MEDVVNNPDHYNTGNIECIDAIEESMSSVAFKGYLKGNCLKYLWRYDYKGKQVEDLEKARLVLKQTNRHGRRRRISNGSVSTVYTQEQVRTLATRGEQTRALGRDSQQLCRLLERPWQINEKTSPTLFKLYITRM